MKQVMFVELGMGADLHGQDVTKAAIRAVRNAIERNSMPGMRGLVGRRHQQDAGAGPSGRSPPMPRSWTRTPSAPSFPMDSVSIHVGPGGMLAPSGIFLADKDDKNEMIYIVNAAVEVGI